MTLVDTLFGYTAASLLLSQRGAVKIKFNKATHCLSYSLRNGARQVIEFDENDLLPVNKLESHVLMLEQASLKTLH